MLELLKCFQRISSQSDKIQKEITSFLNEIDKNNVDKNDEEDKKIGEFVSGSKTELLSQKDRVVFLKKETKQFSNKESNDKDNDKGKGNQEIELETKLNEFVNKIEEQMLREYMR